MDGDTRSIGAIARESGLSVSALRFYDSAGVLRPARVDSVTGYRWYTAEQVGQARLIAALRRVSMSLTDICKVLSVRLDSIAAGRLLDQHLQRLEDGLGDARRQFITARRLLDQQEKPMTTMNVLGTDLADALAAVRFAVSDDPELPALGGVLFDYDGDTLRLVASDRYRLALATVQTTNQHGPAVQVIAPRSLIDDRALSHDKEVTVRLDSQAVTIGGSRSAAIDAVFPDYQRLLQAAPAHQTTINKAALHHRLTTGPTRTMIQAPDDLPHKVSLVLMTEDTIDVLEHEHTDAVAFNREFLLEAIDVAGADQLVLGLDGPIAPLAIVDPDHPDHISLLMPTRLA
jgi:DNA polymerase III subunit beta